MSLALVLAAAACGDDEQDGAKIPADRAKAITDQLDQIAGQVENGACSGARSKFGELQDKVDALPRDVNQDVRDALSDGMSKLDSAIDSDCEQPQETTTEETQPTTTEEAPTTEPETTEETQPETTTEETQPDTTEEQPPTETEPPDDGGTSPLPGDQGDGGSLAPGDDG